MKEERLSAHISKMENILMNFREAKTRGKETNSNEERAQSIADIEDVIKELEEYITNNKNLLELIAGTRIELNREIKWNDIVRPQHFEEDLQEEIGKLKDRL